MVDCVARSTGACGADTANIAVSKEYTANIARYISANSATSGDVAWTDRAVKNTGVKAKWKTVSAAKQGLTKPICVTITNAILQSAKKRRTKDIADATNASYATIVKQLIPTVKYLAIIVIRVDATGAIKKCIVQDLSIAICAYACTVDAQI